MRHDESKAMDGPLQRSVFTNPCPEVPCWVPGAVHGGLTDPVLPGNGGPHCDRGPEGYRPSPLYDCSCNQSFLEMQVIDAGSYSGFMGRYLMPCSKLAVSGMRAEPLQTKERSHAALRSDSMCLARHVPYLAAWRSHVHTIYPPCIHPRCALPCSVAASCACMAVQYP